MAHRSAPEQRPGRSRIERIPLDEKLLDRSRRGRSQRGADLPSRLEACATKATFAPVPVFAPLHPRGKIRQPCRESGSGNSQWIRCIEAEEPEPRPVGRMGDVGGENQLEKIGPCREGP